MEFRDINFQRFLNAIKERWLMSLIIFLVIGGLFSYKVLRTKSIYKAVCKMEFASSVPEISLDNRALWHYSSYVMQNIYLTTQRIVMTSDPVMDKVVRALKLVGPDTDEQEAASWRRAMVGSLEITRMRDSQIFTITARHSDPKMARDIANTTADVYIRHSYEKKLDNYKMSIQWLDEELADLKGKLERAQRNLMEFIEQEKMTESLGSGESGEGGYGFNRSVLEDIEGSIQKLHARKIEEEMELSRIELKYLPAHPEYRRRQNEISLLNQKIAQEEARLQSLREERSQKIITSKKKEIEFSILKREVEINKEIYNALIRKYKETDIGSAIAKTESSIIERAGLPGAPVYPNKQMLIMLSWIVALVFGLAYGVFLEYIDTSIKSPQDVETYLKFPLLGVINAQKDAGRGPLHLVTDDDPALAEPFRILRTNLNFSFPGENRGRIIMVGSTQKGEGKSTVALNLSMVTAELNKRTVLVDCDLRARSISRSFELSKSIGLTSFLVGECDIEQIIHKTASPHLDVIPAGPSPPKPSTLLDSETMRQLLRDLRGRYDEIIIDAPPINIVIDSAIVASIVDGILLVVEAGRVSRTHVRRAIDQLEKVNARLCGFVLTKFDTKAAGYYGYGSQYYYYSGYGYGYVDDHPDDQPPGDGEVPEPLPATEPAAGSDLKA